MTHSATITPYYEQDGITIYHGDCREVLPSLILRDSLAYITDPPYGIEYTTCGGRGEIKGYASWAHTTIANDSDTACRDWLVDWDSVSPMAIFGSWKTGPPKRTRTTLIWDKGPAFGMGDLTLPWKPSFEEIYILGNGWQGRRDEGVLRGHIVVSWESRGRKHPNEKPVSLCTYLISKLPDGCIVIDPFCGSGPTLEAAKVAGRRAIGIEIEERYCEIAANRLRQGVLWGAEASA